MIFFQTPDTNSANFDAGAILQGGNQKKKKKNLRQNPRLFSSLKWSLNVLTLALPQMV